MQAEQQQQIKMLLSNLEEAGKRIPYFSDLQKHPIFSQVIATLSKAEIEEVQVILQNYLLERLEEIKKTKGGQLFARFAQNNLATFWEFRALNAPGKHDQKRFQELGSEIQDELFKLEGILTEKMLKQEKGLDKVVDSFYTLVYLFFPRFNEIE